MPSLRSRPLFLLSLLVWVYFSPSNASVSQRWHHRPQVAPTFVKRRTLQLSPLQHTALPYNIGLSPDNITRGGSDNAPSSFLQVLKSAISVTLATLRVLLPPTVAAVRTIIAFYRRLPIDLVIAQAGLCLCLCGGSYPTLVAAVQAAQTCGLPRMLAALNDLVDEALVAVEATQGKLWRADASYAQVVADVTGIVLQSVDPIKINNACSALYTTWLGVSVVLEKEFARTINLAVTMADYLHPVVQTVLAPPVRLCVPQQYHRWVPVTLGWMSKAITMRIAWRLERIWTAGTSSVMGGLMCSRALCRMLVQRGFRVVGDNPDVTVLDEALGFALAGLGIYVQLGDGKFDPKVKFPFTLLTWPLDIAENWIEWQITK